MNFTGKDRGKLHLIFSFLKNICFNLRCSMKAMVRNRSTDLNSWRADTLQLQCRSFVILFLPHQLNQKIGCMKKIHIRNKKGKRGHVKFHWVSLAPKWTLSERDHWNQVSPVLAGASSMSWKDLTFSNPTTRSISNLHAHFLFLSPHRFLFFFS